MKPQQVPSKEQVRSFMQRPAEQRQALPTPEEIRQQMGWHMLANNTKYVR